MFSRPCRRLVESTDLRAANANTDAVSAPSPRCCALTLQVPEEVPSGRAEVSELQLMADNQSSVEATAEQEQATRLPHAGSQRKYTQMHRMFQKHVFIRFFPFILHHVTEKKKRKAGDFAALCRYCYFSVCATCQDWLANYRNDNNIFCNITD